MSIEVITSRKNSQKTKKTPLLLVCLLGKKSKKPKQTHLLLVCFLKPKQQTFCLLVYLIGDRNYLRRVFGVGADRQERLLRLYDARQRAYKIFRAPAENPLKIPSRPMSFAECQVCLFVRVQKRSFLFNILEKLCAGMWIRGCEPHFTLQRGL